MKVKCSFTFYWFTVCFSSFRKDCLSLYIDRINSHSLQNMSMFGSCSKCMKECRLKILSLVKLSPSVSVDLSVNGTSSPMLGQGRHLYNHWPYHFPGSNPSSPSPKALHPVHHYLKLLLGVWWPVVLVSYINLSSFVSQQNWAELESHCLWLMGDC